MRSFKKGFTLAEVLLTLAIVGIVAALTIPALLNSTNQGELKSAAKKALSALNQAAVMAAGDGTDFTNVKNQTAMIDTLKTKLNVISSDNATNFTLTTADGMIYTATQVPAGGCEQTSTANADQSNTSSCLITVDVNGSKGPGAYSSGSGTSCSFKDKYIFVLRNAVVIAANNSANATTGADCAAQALK